VHAYISFTSASSNTRTLMSQSNVVTSATSHAQSSHPNLVPSQSSGKSSSLAVAPPTTQRRPGSTPPHMVVKRTSDRDARVFVSQETNVAQGVILPASQHAQCSYPRDRARSRWLLPQHSTLNSRRHRNWLEIRQRAQPFGFLSAGDSHSVGM